MGRSLASLFCLGARAVRHLFEKPSRLGGSLLDSLLIEARILTAYVRNFFWPSALCADYGLYSLRDIGLGLSLAVMVCIAVGQVWMSSRNRVFALGAVICLVALLPVSNIIPIFRPMADRFLYLPMIGVALMLAAVCSRVRFTRATIAFALLPITALAVAAAVSGKNLARRRDALDRMWAAEPGLL